MDKINKTDEELKYCYKYPNPSVTTDCVIFGFDGTKLRVLLVQRGIEPFKRNFRTSTRRYLTCVSTAATSTTR